MTSKSTITEEAEPKVFEELPYTPLPKHEAPLCFYKDRARVSPGWHCLRIGLKVCEFTLFQ